MQKNVKHLSLGAVPKLRVGMLSHAIRSKDERVACSNLLERVAQPPSTVILLKRTYG
jgi:hypothetical protein